MLELRIVDDDDLRRELRGGCRRALRARTDEQRDDIAAVRARRLPRERDVRERGRAQRGALEFTECEDVAHQITFASSASFFTSVGMSATI